MTQTYPRTLALIEAREPPDTVTTLAAWLAWRREEDQRMVAELLAQVQAHFEREHGGAVH